MTVEKIPKQIREINVCYSYALNFFPTKSKFGIPNLDLVNKIRIWYTNSRFGIPKYKFTLPNMYFGIPNLNLVYQIRIWYTKSGFGIPNLDLVG